MRLLTVSSQEATFLSREVKKKYEVLSGEELVITSYLARYEGLAALIKTKLDCFDGVDVVSTGLLRKLLESGKRHESTTINRQFIDACYLFITDCKFNRSAYTEKMVLPVEEAPIKEAPIKEAPIKEAPIKEAPIKEAPIKETPIKETPIKETPGDEPSSSSLSWPFKGERLHFSVRKDTFFLSCLTLSALLIGVLAANWQFLLLQVPSPAPKYLWWVAEYPDGTQVYNNFRRYRTEKDVIEHFLGHGLEEGTRTGDCNAIYWTEGNRVNVCYDTIETIRKFEKQHGGNQKYDLMDDSGECT